MESLCTGFVFGKRPDGTRTVSGGVKTGKYRLFERFCNQPEPEKRFPGCIRYVHSPLRRFA